MPLKCSCKNAPVNSIQRAQTMIPVHRLQHSSKQSSNFKNKSRQNCYYCTVPNLIREHSKVCKARTTNVVNVARTGILIHNAEALGHMLEAQDYSYPVSRVPTRLSIIQRLHNTLHCISFPEKSYHK